MVRIAKSDFMHQGFADCCIHAFSRLCVSSILKIKWQGFWRQKSRCSGSMAVGLQDGCGHQHISSGFFYVQGEFGPGSLFGSGSSLFTRTIDNPDSEAKSNNNESPVGRWGSRRASENGAAPRSKAKNGMCGFVSLSMQR